MYGTFGAIYGGSAEDGDTLSTLLRKRKALIMTIKVSIIVVGVMTLPSNLCDEAENRILAVCWGL